MFAATHHYSQPACWLGSIVIGLRMAAFSHQSSAISRQSLIHREEVENLKFMKCCMVWGSTEKEFLPSMVFRYLSISS